MGPIQTAIGQALGAVGGGILVGKKIEENVKKEEAKGTEEQAREEERAKTELVKKALKTAQDKKIDSPKQIYFSAASEEPIASSNEMASVLATQSLRR